MRNKLILSIIIAGFIAFDQMLKILAADFLKPVGQIPLIKGFLNLTYIENKGAAFGFFPGNKFILIILTSILCAGLIWYLLRIINRSKLMIFSLVMIISGGVGNLIDRIRLGYVIDYFHVNIPAVNFDFAVFNFADSCVTVGVILFAASILFTKKHNGNT